MLRLTKEEVEILTTACDSHYDHAVKALSKPGPGAVLNLARNELFHFKPGSEYADVEVTTHQLDTLCKATETLSSIWVGRGGHPKLFEKLMTLLREAGVEYRRLNTAHIEAMKADLAELKEGK